MRSGFRRLIAIALIVAAVMGLVFSILGLLGTWYFKPTAEDYSMRGITLVQDSLEVTSEGLIVTQQALGNTIGSITGLKTTLDGASQALETTQPLMESVATVLDNELPSTISGIQNSLIAAREGARVVDGVLTLLSNLPLFGINYNPDEPLHESFQRVSDDLASLPPSFETMEQNLIDSVDSLSTVQDGMSTMSESIGEIADSLEEYDAVIEQYIDTIDTLLTSLETLQDNLTTIFTFLAIFLSIFFLWMILAQVGLLTQGIELWHGEARYGWETGTTHPEGMAGVENSADKWEEDSSETDQAG